MDSIKKLLVLRKKNFQIALAVLVGAAGLGLTVLPGDSVEETNALSASVTQPRDSQPSVTSPLDLPAGGEIEIAAGLETTSTTTAETTSTVEGETTSTTIGDSTSTSVSSEQPPTTKKAVVPTRPTPKPSPNPFVPNPKPSPQPTVPTSPQTQVQSGGPVPVPKCAYWGAYVKPSLYGQSSNSKGKLAAIRAMENQIGRKYDIDHQFYRWDDFANSHNLETYVRPSANEGRIPFLSWKAVRTNDHNVSWNAIANGSHDALIREKAKAIRGLGFPVFITFDHEANARVGAFQAGDTGGGHVKANAGSEADYVAAWRRIHKIFGEQGANNVSWVWLMSRTPFEGDAKFADRLYPGNQYVDWVGLDPYNFNFSYNGWRTLEAQMQNFTKWVNSRNITKPWMLGEYGSVEDPKQSGRKGEWYRQAGDYIQSEPRLKAAVHYEKIADRDWRITTSASAKAGFIEVGKRSHFNC